MELISSLRTHFGRPQFRPGQQRIVDAVLAGHDVLAVMPTGSGKSLCYQLPAVVLPGVTIVVSPFLSLMKDRAGRFPARFLSIEPLLTGMPPALWITGIISMATQSTTPI